MRRRAEDADVAVVGAGPAGAWTARQLAAGGARVLVFDASHPREKPCGGGITGRALDEIAPAVPVDGLAGVPVESAHFSVLGGPSATVNLTAAGGSRRRLVVTDRRGFDEALLNAAIGAGAEHVCERVTDIESTPTGVTVLTRRRRYRCARVVGADGANSLVRRRVLAPFARADLSVATGYFAFGPASPDVHVDFVEDPPGYLWSFPRRDHLAIGICAQATSTALAPLASILHDRLQALAPSGARLVRYSWPIPSLSRSSLATDRPAGDRWFLAGDAAGLVDPITREGIFFALRSASLLAEALLAGDGGSERYTAAVRREIHPELAHAARLKRGFFAGPFTHLLVEALAESGAVRNVMADLVAGEQPYHTLKRRLVATLEFKLAWRLLLLEAGVTRRKQEPLHQRTM